MVLISLLKILPDEALMSMFIETGCLQRSESAVFKILLLKDILIFQYHASQICLPFAIIKDNNKKYNLKKVFKRSLGI